MNRPLLHTFLGLCLLSLGLSPAPAAFAARSKEAVIVSPRNASWMESLAAREVRRYVYLRTGRLLPIVSEPVPHPKGEAILVGRKDRALITAAMDGQFAADLSALAPQSYWLKTVPSAPSPTHKPRRLLLIGGDDPGTLYAAYRFAEQLGIRFYLHGDVIPDEPMKWQLPILDERQAPLFALRGIQPFHDFPEGPDWWNRDDYLAIIGQLPKLRMNFIGLHTYPEGHPNAEPSVWIGLPRDLGSEGTVRFSYSASYMNTVRGNWGYGAKRTSEYICGSGALFEREDYGPEVMYGAMPWPERPELNNAVFNRAAAVLREAFSFARQVGVKTCVGTETPLVIPQLVRERLKGLNQKPEDPAVLQELYEGIFRRTAAAYPLDYYWFWTPEGWTWSGVKAEQIGATTNDIGAALAAHRKVQPPFGLATCGWVLGPQQDRALFDKVLPKEVAVSCINRQVGYTPVDAGFGAVQGRSKWAIPWLEDDGALTSPQLWVGRMRRDAADALRYGCDGLLGIHWRTRVLSPNVAALAQAAWDQARWLEPGASPAPPAPRTGLGTTLGQREEGASSPQPSPPEEEREKRRVGGSAPSPKVGRSARPAPRPPRMAGAVGGQAAAFPNNPIADTAHAPLYQTVRYNLSAYHLPATNGPCRVTLQFCEPHYDAAGKRVFDVKLQGATVLTNLDIFAQAGKNRALDFTFSDIRVTNGWLDIEFIPRIEFPSIAAIAVEGTGFTNKINCGGPGYQEYAADAPPAAPPKEVFPPTKDFYEDWAVHEFGPEAGLAAAGIFEKIDCDLPKPSVWVHGPGSIRPDPRPWEQASRDYAFVKEFAALRSRIKGTGNLERFDYWLNTFLYFRTIGEVNCAWAECNRALEKAKAEKDPAAQKGLARQCGLPARRELVRLVNRLYEHLLATVSTTGELGTVANWNQQNLPDLLTRPGDELAKLLGEALPADAQPAQQYSGPTRVIVPTKRASLAAHEPLSLKVMILSADAPAKSALYWRKLGEGRFASMPLKHVVRGVYSVELPAPKADFEYYVEVQPVRGKPIRFPATAPKLNQTVVVYSALPGSH